MDLLKGNKINTCTFWITSSHFIAHTQCTVMSLLLS